MKFMNYKNGREDNNMHDRDISAVTHCITKELFVAFGCCGRKDVEACEM